MLLVVLKIQITFVEFSIASAIFKVILASIHAAIKIKIHGISLLILSVLG